MEDFKRDAKEPILHKVIMVDFLIFLERENGFGIMEYLYKEEDDEGI